MLNLHILIKKKAVLLHRILIRKSSTIPDNETNSLEICHFCGFGAGFLGCSKAIEDYPKFNLREIAYFAFDYYHNSENNIFIQHAGVIDETNRYITVSVPTDADLTLACR